MNKLFYFFLIILLFIVYRNWYLTDVVSSGDSWYYFSSMYSNHFIHPYAWYNTVVSNGLGGQGFAYMNVNIVVGLLLEIAKLFGASWELLSKIFFYLLFLVLSSFSSIFLIKKLFPENNFWILTPLIFIFNTYILMVVGGGQIITAISYSLIPISFYLIILVLDESKNFFSGLQNLILFSLVFSLQCVLDLRIAFITAIAVGVYFFVSFFEKIKIAKILNILTSAVFILLMCAYWIIPMLFYGIDPIAQLGIDYRSTEIVKFLSFAKLENSIALMHPYWPDNIFGKIGFMKPEFLLLPILAFISLFSISKKNKSSKYIIYFSIISLIGIFLGKGANDPFGSIYLFLFDNIPGFQLFRDSFKWYALIALGYMILIPLSSQNIYSYLKAKNNKNRNKFINFQNIFLALLFAYFFFLLRPAISNELNGTFKTRVVPESYIKLNEYLVNDKSFYRTLWIPQAMQFSHYTNNHASIAGRDFFREYSHDLLIRKLSSESTKKTLEASGVKYVIIPEDTESEIYLTDREYDESKYKYIVESIDKISWLKKDKSFGKIKVYKTENYKDHFWCNCDAKISYEMINPTRYKIKVENANKNDKLIFSEAFDSKWVLRNAYEEQGSVKYDRLFNSFTLPQGNSEFEVVYTPQKLVEIGTIISLITIFISVSALIITILLGRRK